MSVTKIMADSEYLRECQDLFELYVSDYIMLMRCKVGFCANYVFPPPFAAAALYSVQDAKGSVPLNM